MKQPCVVLKRGISCTKRALNVTSQEKKNTYSLLSFFFSGSPSFPLLCNVELKETYLLTKEPYIDISDKRALKKTSHPPISIPAKGTLQNSPILYSKRHIF